MPKFCTNCGAPLKEGAKFCTSCGAPVTNTPESGQAKEILSSNQLNTAGTVPKRAVPSGIPPASPQIRPQQPFAQKKNEHTGAQTALGEQPDTMGQLKEMFFSTEGRLNRKPYNMRAILYGFIGQMVAGLLWETDIFLLMAVGLIFWIIIFVAQIMLAIRRTHDLGKSGWFALLLFVPIINIVYGIFLVFVRGTVGQNQYGADPLQV